MFEFGRRDGGFSGPSNTNTVYHSKRSYQQGKHLGTGGFGTVYQVVRHQDDRVFAMKIAKRNSGAQANIEKEIYLLTELRYRFIVRLVDTAGTKLEPCLVMELASSSVAWYGDKWRGEEKMTQTLSCHILAALRHIHDHNVAHRDIKADNILVTSTDPPHFRLADFGCAENIVPATQFRTHLSDVYHVEVKRTGPSIPGHADEMDVYCFGLVVYWLLTRGPVPRVHRYKGPGTGHGRAMQWRTDTRLMRALSRDARHFIIALLKLDPCDRPAATALEHTWLKAERLVQRI